VTAIRIPYRDRSDPLSVVGELARQLPPDETATVRQLVIGGVEAGLSTVGELLDRLDALDPHGRRTLLDNARASAGLPPAPRAHHVEPISDEPERDEAGATWPVCHEPGCRAYPTNVATGAPEKSRARRWRCSEHAAGHEEDMLPWASSIVMGPAGLRDLDAEESERVLAHREAERRAVAHTQRLAARAAELPAAEIEAAAEAEHWIGDNLRMPA
jgi:hypothetical protein